MIKIAKTELIAQKFWHYTFFVNLCKAMLAANEKVESPQKIEPACT